MFLMDVDVSVASCPQAVSFCSLCQDEPCYMAALACGGPAAKM